MTLPTTPHVTAPAGTTDDASLLTLAEVAAMLRTPAATLRYWRHLGTGPRSFRVGRGVRYWQHDVLAWLQDQEQNEQSRSTAATRR